MATGALFAFHQGPTVAQALPDVDVEVDVDSPVEVDEPNDVVEEIVEEVIEGMPGEEGASQPGASRPRVPLGRIEHSRAVEAVHQNRAMPLDQLLAAVAQTYPQQVLDVQLVMMQDRLLYEVRMLGARGVVFTAYFGATTGELVMP